VIERKKLRTSSAAGNDLADVRVRYSSSSTLMSLSRPGHGRILTTTTTTTTAGRSMVQWNQPLLRI